MNKTELIDKIALFPTKHLLNLDSAPHLIDNKEIENHSKALLCFAGKGRVIL